MPLPLPFIHCANTLFVNYRYALDAAQLKHINDLMNYMYVKKC